MMARALKGPLALVLAVMMAFSGGGMVAYGADTPVLAEDGIPYNAGDVAAINKMIAENSLPLTPNSPASWENTTTPNYVIWSEIDGENRITTLRVVVATGVLDVSGLTKLKFLETSSTDITGFYFGQLPNLNTLECPYTKISELDLSPVPNLVSLDISDTAMDIHKVKSLPAGLNALSIGNTNLTHLDLPPMPQLKRLECGGNPISELDLTFAPNLDTLACGNTNLSKLDLSPIPNLRTLSYEYTNITELDLSKVKQLKDLCCGGEGVTIPQLDLSDLTELRSFSCQFARLPNLDLTNNQKLDCLEISNTTFDSITFPNGTKITFNQTEGGKIVRDNREPYYLIRDDADVSSNNRSVWRAVPDDYYEFDCWVTMPEEATEGPWTASFTPSVRQGEPAKSYSLEAKFKKFTYPVTVIGGTVMGDRTEFSKGDTVTIQANEAPEGKKFTGWYKDSGNPELADATAPRTTFTMPARGVTFVAQFGNADPDTPDNPDTPDTPEIPKTPEEIKQEAETTQDPERLKDLEDAYKNLTGTTVNVLADNNTHGDFKNQVDKISVTGAAFNVEPGETVSLHFSKPQNNVTIDGTKYKTNSAVQLDISLRSGEKVLSRLAVPVTITVPIPSGVNPQNFWILHYNDAGEYEVINPTLNGDGTCSFTVDHFSVFAFVNAAGTPDPVEPAGEEKQEKKEKDDSNHQAVKAALEAIRAAKPGKQQTAATADGRQVTVVPVKLFGLSASLPVDALETIAEGTIGLRVVLDNGAAEVLIPAGFRMPAGTGVLAYGLGWQAEPLYSNLMRADVKEEGAKTEVYKLGGGTLPTTATITLKTKLTGKINVYRWNEDTRRVALVASPAAEGGRVTFAAKELGNFILTTGTI